MGRVTSIYQLMQSAIQVVFILVIGWIADTVSLRLTIVVLALMMSLLSIVFSFAILKPERKGFYRSAT